MKTISHLLVLLVLLQVVTSCSVMPVCQSSKIDVSTNENKIDKTTFFDQNSNIRFFVSDDETNLQVIMVFDSLNLQKISENGFYLYFDPTGKKKRDISLKIFPERKNQKDFNRSERSGRTRNDTGQNFLSFNYNSVDQLTSAIWKTKNNIYAFDIRFSLHPITVKTKTLENGEFQVKVLIPLTELDSKPVQYLSLGIETEKANNSSNNSRPAMPPDMGQGMGGGMMGGPMGGGMPGGGPGRMEPGGNQSSSSQLCSWIKVYL